MKKFIKGFAICSLLLTLPALSESLLNTPSGSKVIFTQNFKIPPNETSVPIGKMLSGGYITECSLEMKTYDNALRMIPKGTEFKVKDTQEGYGFRSDLILESNSVRGIICESHKPVRDPSWPTSESELKIPGTADAQSAMKGKITLKLNKEPKLVKD